jgi:P27 family predicted phage terminase small subunit
MPKGGHNRKPTALHKLHGDPGMHTKAELAAREAVEPPDDPGGMAAPADLSADQKRLWDHAVAHAPRGVLKATDKTVLRAWCVTVDMHDKTAKALSQQSLIVASPSGRKINPLFRIWSEAASKLLKIAAELGFSPASRPRLAGLVGQGLPPVPIPSDQPRPGRPSKRSGGPVLTSISDYIANSPDRKRTAA